MKIKTYENSINKRLVQYLCYSQIFGIESDLLCLAGPNAKEFIEFAQSQNKKKIISYEKEMSIYLEQLNLLYSTKKLKNKVQFKSGDIINAQPQQVIDLDLMCTFKSAQNTISKLLYRQYTMNSNIKCFMFSVSYMRESSSIEPILKFINKLLGVECFLVNSLKMQYGVQHFINCRKNVIVRAYSYCDTSPMHTIQIIY